MGSLVPVWAKDPKRGFRTINARCETVATTPAFRAAFKSRRCLIPVDGFYEWQKREKGPKQPYFVGMKDGEPFCLAGLWEGWQDPESKEWLRTFTIITCGANALVAKLHDRMPVIIALENYERWLQEGGRDLLKPFPADRMTMWPVSREVNSPSNEGPDLIEPMAA
jgi:putative SOS response-associated peptidase YedK